MKKPKEYIFIDTSSFRSNGFFKKGEFIQRVFDLSEKGYITIIMPAITEHEWKKHYDENSNFDFNEIERKARIFGLDDTDLFIEKYASQAEDYIQLKKDAWKHHMNRAKIERLPYEYPSDKLKEIFEKYISGDKPFGTGKKKHEFPDAFALASVVKYAEENSIDKVIVFSQDKDITEFSSDKLVLGEPKTFLERYTLHIIPKFTTIQQEKADIDTKLLKCYIGTQPSRLLNYVTDEIEEYLQDDSNYSESLNFIDIDDVEIRKLVVNLNSDNLDILSITEDAIEVSLLVDIAAVVSVTHFDEEMSVWDSEEKDYLIKMDTTSELKFITSCRVHLSYARSEEIDIEDYFDEDAIEFGEFDFSNLKDAILESAPWYRRFAEERNNEWRQVVNNHKKLADMYTPEIVKQMLDLKEKLNKLINPLPPNVFR